MRQQLPHRVMCADAPQPGLVHRLPELRRGVVVVAGGFNLGVAVPRHLLQCAVEILGQKLAHAIKLQPNRLVQRRS